jgi:D-alanine transaminase
MTERFSSGALHFNRLLTSVSIPFMSSLLSSWLTCGSSHFSCGIYEVTKAYAGLALFGEAEHMKRLVTGLEALSITNSVAKDFVAQLPTISRKLLLLNGLEDKDATVYLQVTQGVAPGGRAHYYPPPETPPTIYVFAKPMAAFAPGFFEDGVTATVMQDIRWGRCDIKTTSLLPNAMAKEKAKQHGAYECLLTRDEKNADGTTSTYIVEASHSNVFGVIDGALWTTPLGSNILPGITRNLIVEKATKDLGIPIVEKPIPVDRWSEVTEVFTTSTGPDVAPIINVLGIGQVGDGKVGPITKKLLAAFRGEWLEVDKETSSARLEALGYKVDHAAIDALRAELAAGKKE